MGCTHDKFAADLQKDARERNPADNVCVYADPMTEKQHAMMAPPGDTAAERSIRELQEELEDAQELAQMLVLQNDRLMTEKDELIAQLRLLQDELQGDFE